MLQPGYKETEVGVLPVEWEVKRLGELLSTKPSYGINAAAVPYSPELPTYLRITDISEDGTFVSEGRTSVAHSSAAQYFLNDDQIVVARTGASTGKSYLYDRRDGKLVFAGFLIRVQPNPRRLLPTFLRAFIQTPAYWNWVATASVRSGQPGINSDQLSRLVIPLPPLEEQQAIAATLGAVDALLTEQRALLAKKRDLKQATQWALLTGKRRLPGFGGEWEESTISQAFVFHSTGNFSRAEMTDSGEVACLHYGDIHTKYHGVIDCGTARLPFLRVAKPRNLVLLQDGDLVMADASEDYDGVGKSVEVRGVNGKQIVAGLHTILLRGNPKMIAPGFAALLPVMEKTRYDLLQIATGVSVYGITKGNVAACRIDLPSLPEQHAIAQVLSDMDAELETLAQQVAKTEHLKAGLMHDLLTGRRRLTGGRGGGADGL